MSSETPEEASAPKTEETIEKKEEEDNKSDPGLLEEEDANEKNEVSEELVVDKNKHNEEEEIDDNEEEDIPIYNFEDEDDYESDYSEQIEEKEIPKDYLKQTDFTFDVDIPLLNELKPESEPIIVGPISVENHQFQLSFYIGKDENVEDIINVQLIQLGPEKITGFHHYDASLVVLPERNPRVFNHGCSLYDSLPAKNLLIPYLYKCNNLPSEPLKAKLILHFAPIECYAKDYLGCTGLVNMGMTCYLNSLLQCLYHLKPFRKIVFSLPRDQTNEIASQLCNLFVHMQIFKNPSSTRRLTAAFGWRTAELFQQHDVQELMKLLFDRLDSCCNDAISSLFQFQSKSIIRGLEKQFEVSHDEEYTDLSLQVGGCKTVEESISKFFEFDKLIGSDQYQMEDGTKVDAEKGLELVSTPTVLVLHLRRFEYVNGDFEKIMSRFEFGTSLDFHGESYDLFGVIVHGGSVFGGHYIVYIQINGEWYCFDDEIVRKCEVEEATVDKFGGQKFQKKTAYVLFYVKKGFMDEKDPEVPHEIEEEERKRYTQVTHNMYYIKDGKLDMKEIKIDKSSDKEKFLKAVSEESEIPLDKLVLREMKGKEIREIIHDIPDFKSFYVDSTEDIPMFVELWVPGYYINNLDETIIHAQKGQTFESFADNIKKHLGIENVEMKNENEQVVPAINESMSLVYSLSDDSCVEHLSKTFNFVPIKDEGSDSFTSIMKPEAKTYEDYQKYYLSVNPYTFQDIQNPSERRIIMMSDFVTGKEMAEMLSKLHEVDPQHILILSPTNVQNIESEMALTLSNEQKLIFYEIAPVDIRCAVQVMLIFIDEKQVPQKQVSEYFILGEDTIEKLFDRIKTKYETQDFVLIKNNSAPVIVFPSSGEIKLESFDKFVVQTGIKYPNENEMILKIVHVTELFKTLTDHFPFCVLTPNPVTWKDVKELVPHDNNPIMFGSGSTGKKISNLDNPNDDFIFPEDNQFCYIVLMEKFSYLFPDQPMHMQK